MPIHKAIVAWFCIAFVCYWMIRYLFPPTYGNGPRHVIIFCRDWTKPVIKKWSDFSAPYTWPVPFVAGITNAGVIEEHKGGGETLHMRHDVNSCFKRECEICMTYYRIKPGEQAPTMRKRDAKGVRIASPDCMICSCPPEDSCQTAAIEREKMEAVGGTVHYGAGEFIVKEPAYTMIREKVVHQSEDGKQIVRTHYGVSSAMSKLNSKERHDSGIHDYGFCTHCPPGTFHD